MIRRFIIAFLFLVPMLAFSNEPSIAPIKGSREQQSVSKKYDKKSEPDNRGTDKSPVFIKIIPTEPTHEQSKQETKVKLEKSLNDKVLVYSTLALTVATILLALFTYRLWSATVKMSKDAKDTSDRQAAEMTKSLEFTQKSIDLAKQEFVFTHRPRLIIRSISVKTRDNPLFGLENGKPFQFEWCVVNTGDSPCEIVESSINTSWDTIPFDTKSLYFDQPMMNGKRILPGAFEPFKFTSDIVFDGPPVQHTLQTEKKAIYFYGFIKYRDDITTVRYTAFCRSYDPVAKRFIASDNSDCEYAD